MSTEHTPETPEHFQARSVLVRAIAGYRDGVGPDCAEIAALIAERDKLTAERDKLRAALKECEHQVSSLSVWGGQEFKYHPPQAGRIAKVCAEALK